MPHPEGARKSETHFQEVPHQFAHSLMNFSAVFEKDATEDIRRRVFVADVLSMAFQSALDKALEQLWKHHDDPEPTQKLLLTGLNLFVSVTRKISSEKAQQLLADDHVSSQIIWKLGHSSESLVKEIFHDNLTDITSMNSGKNKSNSLNTLVNGSNALADFTDLADFADLADFGTSKSSNAQSNVVKEDTTSVSQEGDLIVESSIGIDEDPFQIANSIMSVFGQVFKAVFKIFDLDKSNLLTLLFPDSDETSVFTSSHLHVFLAHLNVFMKEIVQSQDCDNYIYVDSAILFLFDLAATLTQIMYSERFSRSENSLREKTLFRIFFAVNFSDVFLEILETTVPSTSLGEDDADLHSPRIEFKTALRIYALLSELSGCPVSLLSLEKETFLMDIGSNDDSSSNVYRDFQDKIDFAKSKNITVLESRFIPALSALFNYFYDLQPDLLLHSLNHSSFFGWITGHAFASDLYVAINTIEKCTSLTELLEKSMFPFIDSDDKLLENLNSENALKAISNKVFELPSFFIVSLAIKSLIRNGSFVKYLTTTSSNEKISLLDIWLCVASYVSQHQKISHHGRSGVKSFLLVLLELTASKSPALSQLKDHKINENIWKLCHQKAPFLPLCTNGPEISALLYCIDVLQITLRFNISKNFSLDNAKIALTVLYQILKECEVRPYDDLNNFRWKEVYETLVHFILFVTRHRNDEDVKYVIEEVFSIFELVLSPTFAKVIEKSADFYLIGNHIIKSMNYDLFYIILHEYKSLLNLFERFIIDESNFQRTRKAFETLESEFKLKESKEIDESTVVPILNRLSLLSDEDATETVVDQKKFNYAETLKYWLMSNEQGKAEAEAEYFELYVQLFNKRQKYKA